MQVVTKPVSTRRKRKRAAEGGGADEKQDEEEEAAADQQMEEFTSGDGEQLPFACFICRGPFVRPVVTRYDRVFSLVFFRLFFILFSFHFNSIEFDRIQSNPLYQFIQYAQMRPLFL